MARLAVRVLRKRGRARAKARCYRCCRAAGEKRRPAVTSGLQQMSGVAVNMAEVKEQARRQAVLARAAADFADPVSAAKTLIEAEFERAGRRLLHFNQGEFHSFNGSAYRVMPPADMRAMLYRIGTEVSANPIKRRQVDDVLDAMRAVSNLSDAISAPCWLEPESGDPDPRRIIPVRNGLLLADTRELLPPDPRFFSVYNLPFDYTAAAHAPRVWLNFLDAMLAGDEAAIALLQEWVGYCLTQDTSQQKGLLIIGPKRSGKGTFARVQAHMCGAENVCGPTLGSLAMQFGLHSLMRKLLAIVSDARLTGRTDVAAVGEALLRIIGEDRVTVPRKYLPDWTGTLPTRFMILTNEAPRFADGSGALVSRFLVVRLTRSFYGKEDPRLTEKLLAEAPGIFNWALDGLARLRARGHFVQPESGLQAIADMDQLSSPMSTFLEDECETSDPAATVACLDLFQAWAGWCKANGREHPGDVALFGRNLRAVLPHVETRQRRESEGRVRYFQGVRLK